MSLPLVESDLAASFEASARTLENRYQDPGTFHAWFRARREAAGLHVERIPFDRLRGWRFDPGTGDLGHESGRFFQVIGCRVRVSRGAVAEWEQPIIRQPEVGVLGVLTRVTGGVRHFLMQAKAEPGNVGAVQLSPTVQATRSNYTRAHGGATPPYLEYFLERGHGRVLVDRLQSEQGARFLRKRNRNIIVEVDEEPEAHPDFRWLTLGEVRRLLARPSLVNMDARSVLANCPLPEADEGRSLHSIDELVGWITEQRSLHHVEVEPIPLGRTRAWRRTADELAHRDGRYFRVVAVEASAERREVARWTQPLLASVAPGLVGLVARRIRGAMHYLVQAKMEPGGPDGVEMAPTVSCSGPLDRYTAADRPPFLEAFLRPAAGRLLLDTVQSEEGGRFWRFENRNAILEVAGPPGAEEPEGYAWMTHGQILEFLRHGYCHMDLRSLLSAMVPGTP